MDREKRSAERIDAKVVAHCMKNVEGANLPFRFISFTKDLSSSGAHLVSSREVSKGDKFLITLEIPTSFIPLIAFSEVIWAQHNTASRADQKESTEAGVRFVNMDEADARKLREYLNVKFNRQGSGG